MTLSIRQLVDSLGGSLETEIMEAKELPDGKTFAIGVEHKGNHYSDEFVPNAKQAEMLLGVEAGEPVQAIITHDADDITADIVVDGMKVVK